MMGMIARIESLDWGGLLGSFLGFHPKEERCPSPRKLLKAARSHLSERKQQQILDHVSHCGSCAGEYEFIKIVVAEGEGLKAEIGRVLDSCAAPPLPRSQPGLFPSLNQGFRWATYSLSILLFFVAVSFRSPVFAHRVDQGTLNNQMRIYFQAQEDSFRQEEYYAGLYGPAVAEYYMEIYDDTVFIVWRDQKSAKRGNKSITLTQRQSLYAREMITRLHSEP